MTGIAGWLQPARARNKYSRRKIPLVGIYGPLATLFVKVGPVNSSFKVKMRGIGRISEHNAPYTAIFPAADQTSGSSRVWVQMNTVGVIMHRRLRRGRSWQARCRQGLCPAPKSQNCETCLF